MGVSHRSARPNFGAGLLRKAQMQNPSTRPTLDKSLRFQFAQSSAEIAHARLCGGAEIPSDEDLTVALSAGHRMINALRGLLGVGGAKGGAA